MFCLGFNCGQPEAPWSYFTNSMRLGPPNMEGRSEDIKMINLLNLGKVADAAVKGKVISCRKECLWLLNMKINRKRLQR